MAQRLNPPAIANPEPTLSNPGSANIAQLELAPTEVLTLPGYTPAADGFRFFKWENDPFFLPPKTARAPGWSN